MINSEKFKFIKLVIHKDKLQFIIKLKHKEILRIKNLMSLFCFANEGGLHYANYIKKQKRNTLCYWNWENFKSNVSKICNKSENISDKKERKKKK